MTTDGSVWLAEVKLHPGRPYRCVLVAALERLLAHRHPAIVLRRIEETGAPVPADRPAEAIAEAWEAAGAPAAFEVQAQGGGTLVITTQDVSIGLLGSLSLHWALDRALDDGLVELAADLSGILSSPLAVLSHTSTDWRVRAGWQSRRAHRGPGAPRTRPPGSGSTIRWATPARPGGGVPHRPEVADGGAHERRRGPRGHEAISEAVSPSC